MSTAITLQLPAAWDPWGTPRLVPAGAGDAHAPALTSGATTPDDGTTSHAKVVDVPAIPWHETKNQRDRLPASNREPSAHRQARATNPRESLNGVAHFPTPACDDVALGLRLANAMWLAVNQPRGKGRS